MPLREFRKVPSYDAINKIARRVPEVDPMAVETCLQILRVSSEMVAALDAHYERNGLSRGRFRILINLFREPDAPLTPAELSDRTGVTRATVTGLLDGLERDGLVKRMPHPEDRRMMLVHITERGTDFMESFLPGHYTRIAELMRNLGDAERNNLVKFLLKVEEGIKTLFADESPESQLKGKK